MSDVRDSISSLQERGVPYEQRLSREPRWALTEGSIFFEGQGSVQKSLRQIAERLNNLGIPYAIVGGMALFQHGVRRFTEGVDILVSRDSLKQIHEKLDGLGYVTPFKGSKNLRDVDTGVKIEFLIAGAFPGDGKPKPVAFPPPETVSFEHDGIKYLNLESLVELKLASGMTDPGRQKDLADVMAIIKELKLPAGFGERLHEYVRGTYLDLWNKSMKRFIRVGRNKFLTTEARSIEEMAAILKAAADELEQMKRDGVTLDPGSGTADDNAHLVTTDPNVAAKYDMHEEDEFWDEAPDETDPRKQ